MIDYLVIGLIGAAIAALIYLAVRRGRMNSGSGTGGLRERNRTDRY